MCDLDVYSYLYQGDLQEYQAASRISLQVSNFIVVPITKSIKLPTESQSPQSPDTESKSKVTYPNIDGKL
jgi:hypothetical protein